MTRPALSFEIFPPANLPASFKLWDTVTRLQAFAPEFLSVTYGAQGSQQGRTAETLRAIHGQTDLRLAAHLTAARASKSDILARAEEFAEMGVTDIVALRGDGAGPGGPFEPHPDGFKSSVELVAALAKTGNYNIRVGAYPDGHPDAKSAAQNIDFLKAKFDAGATEAITQFFFEPDSFLRFRDACVKAGITNPIIPGILPIANWNRVRGFAERCGAQVPGWLDQAFETAIRDDRHDLLSIAVTTELCSKLLEEGVSHLHLYSLNSARMSEQLCTALGCAPVAPPLRNVA